MFQVIRGETSQKWAITLMADKWWEDNYCNILPMCNTNLGMDVYNADINSGTNVWVCRRNGTVAQRFRIVILDQNFILSKPTPIVYPGGSKSDTVIRWAGIDHADSYNVEIVSQTGTVIVNETVYGDSVYAKNCLPGNIQRLLQL